MLSAMLMAGATTQISSGTYVVFSKSLSSDFLYKKLSGDVSDGSAITSVIGLMPTYSPDGTKIVYVLSSGQLIEKDASDSSNGTILTSPVSAAYPKYSIDSNFIFYASSGQIIKKNSGLVRDGIMVNAGASYALEMAMSPDGNYLTYTNNNDGNKLYKMGIASTTNEYSRKDFTIDDRASDGWTYNEVGIDPTSISGGYWITGTIDSAADIYKRFDGGTAAGTKIRISSIITHTLWGGSNSIVFEDNDGAYNVWCTINQSDNPGNPIGWECYVSGALVHEYTSISEDTEYQPEIEQTTTGYVFRLYASDGTTLLSSYTHTGVVVTEICRVRLYGTSGPQKIGFIDADVNYYGVSDGSAITSVDSISPDYSPNGNYIIYVNQTDGGKIYRKNANDSANGSAINSEGSLDCRYSPDGAFITYIRGSDGKMVTKSANDSSNGSVVSVSGNLHYIAYSPN